MRLKPKKKTPARQKKEKKPAKKVDKFLEYQIWKRTHKFGKEYE